VTTATRIVPTEAPMKVRCDRCTFTRLYRQAA
jgi:hypothetical protein